MGIRRKRNRWLSGLWLAALIGVGALATPAYGGFWTGNDLNRNVFPLEPENSISALPGNRSELRRTGMSAPILTVLLGPDLEGLLATDGLGGNASRHHVVGYVAYGDRARSEEAAAPQ